MENSFSVKFQLFQNNEKGSPKTKGVDKFPKLYNGKVNISSINKLNNKNIVRN